MKAEAKERRDLVTGEHPKPVAAIRDKGNSDLPSAPLHFATLSLAVVVVDSFPTWICVPGSKLVVPVQLILDPGWTNTTALDCNVQRAQTQGKE